MRIHALTVDRGGCFHYRVRQPLTYLRDRGHWTSWGSGIDAETWQRADVLVAQILNRERTARDWVAWCEAAEKLCVWDADDDLFTVHEHPGHGAAYDDPLTVPMLRKMISASHLVTVTTAQLAEVYEPLNANVVVVPNYVPDWLVELPPAPEGDHARLVLGYTGSASHVDDYAAWSPVLVRHMASYGHRTLLRYWGMRARPEGIPLAWPVQTWDWQKDTRAYLRSLRMDVGVAPLLDTPFNRGKSGVKALEYAARGIPAVTASAQQYRDVVLDGLTGFLCSRERDWRVALSALWEDDELRARMGARARDHVRAHYLASSGARLLETVYRDAARRVGVHVGG